jgi:aspartate aminotransferase
MTLILSERAKLMPASPIRKLVPFAEDAKRRGIKVYHLNIGQPDIPTPKNMLDAYRKHNINILEYGHSGGLWEYRESLTRYYRKFDINVSKEEILVTTAGSEAIIFTMMILLNPGEEVIIPEPFYTNYNGFAIEAGVKIIPVACKAEDGFKLPHIEKIKEKINPNTRAILICNPNNPTGYVYSREELQLLSELVLKNNLFLISDEVYREFVYDGAKHISVMHLKGIEDRAVMVDSISKRYSACGARVGCIVTKNNNVLDAALRFGQARLCPPTMEQLAAMAAVDTPQEYMDEVLKEYQQRRDIVFETLSKIPGVVASKPAGAFYSVIKLPIDDADNFCIWLLKDFHDNNETVMLAPANGFYATPGLGKDEVRLAFVLNVESMKRSMQILEKALNVYPGRKV